MNKRILIILITILLTGCNVSKPIPDKSMFKVDFEIPGSIQAGQEVIAKAYLTNISKRSWSIFHGVDIFTVGITNNEGKLLKENDTLIVIALGISSDLKPNKQYSLEDGTEQFRELKISVPGIYYVTINAKFSIDDKDFLIKSETKKIIVK
ncbi:hypothetical protein [Cohnella soli]|uniref:Lipoprotein n=1 Tax=Cohnella soli TaxID=425005 RepID=A0ABW0I3B2_9BACL